MQFSIATIVAFAAMASTTLAAPTVAPVAEMVTIEERSEPIEKRVVIVAIGAIVGTAALTTLTTAAVEEAVTAIKAIGPNWTAAREKFTQQTTKNMWVKNPNTSRWPGVACYNMAYTLKDPKNIDGKINAKLSSGVLNTDYDCMYIGSGNTFYSGGDGGYINAAFYGTCKFSNGDYAC